jgi:hypothetical protein
LGISSRYLPANHFNGFWADLTMKNSSGCLLTCTHESEEKPLKWLPVNAGAADPQPEGWGE